MRQLCLGLISVLVVIPLMADPIQIFVARTRQLNSNLGTAASETKRPVEAFVALLEQDGKDLAEIELAVSELETGTKESLERAAGRVSRVSTRAFQERLSSASSLREAKELLKDAVAAYPAIDGARLQDELHHLALHPVRDVLRQHIAAADVLREGIAESVATLQVNATLLEEAMTRGLLERTPEVAR